MPETYSTEKTTKTEDKKNNQTVYRNNSKRYYTKLDNASLRMKIPGEDKVTAKDIWLDALTCQDDWLFTTKNIADRWGISLKRANNKLALLSKSGFAEPQKIIDPTDHKFLMHIWIFHEKPHAQKRGYGKSIIKPKNNTKKPPKNHMPKNGHVHHLLEGTTLEASLPPPSKLSDEIKSRIKDSGISEKLVIKCQEKFEDDEYTIAAIDIAKKKYRPERYFRFLSQKKYDSVLDVIEENKKPITKSIEKRDNDPERNLEGKRVKVVSTGKIYEIDCNGAIMMKSGCLPRVRIEKFINEGKFQYL